MSGEATSCMGYGAAIGNGLVGLLLFFFGIVGCSLVLYGAREFRLRRRLKQDHGVLIQATVTKVKETKGDDPGVVYWYCTYQYHCTTSDGRSRRVLVERTILIPGGNMPCVHYAHGDSIDVLMLPEDPLSGRALWESLSLIGPVYFVILGMIAACFLSSGLVLAISHQQGDGVPSSVCGWSKPAILLAVCYGIPLLLVLYQWLTGGSLDYELGQFSKIIEECNIGSDKNDSADCKEGIPEELELASVENAGMTESWGARLD
jgi:hypothetical protein